MKAKYLALACAGSYLLIAIFSNEFNTCIILTNIWLAIAFMSDKNKSDKS